jgi:hypothetical protein
MSRLLFKWADDALIAANTGRRFTHGGLEAICSSHLSDKLKGEQHEFASEADAKEAVCRIRKRELKVYSDSPSRLIQDARLEVETGRDYSNRLLLELMQNADDAAATARIGYKGLGFKSVLDVCESARIYSGCLRVRFDRAESERALHEAGLTELTEVPVLRLPFWIRGDSDAGVDDLLKGYQTVIVLPWKSGVVPTPFETEWKSVCADASVLLLLHALEEVVWEGPQSGRVEWRCRRGDNIELSVTASDRAAVASRWQIRRGSTANHRSAVIVRLDDEGKPIPYRHDKIRVFFPTEEASPLPIILHGEFDLEQNRKHVRPGGTRNEIVQSLARCVELALSEIADDGQFLDLLQPRIPPENMTALEREIWEAVSAVLLETTLPQSKVRLCEVRLCPEASAQGFPWYRQRLVNWKAFKELMVKHRPGGVAGLNLLLPGADTEEREKTVCAFNPKAHLTMEELVRLPMFPVAGADRPVAACDCHLFFPAEKMQAPVALPNVPIAFLQAEFSAGCKKHRPVEEVLKKLGVAEFSPSAIAVALAKSHLDAVPQETLWEFLSVTVAPMLKEVDAVMDWKDKDRQILAEHVKVPCRDGVWAVAVNVYAGQDWTKDDFLERAYRSNSKRRFLTAPPTDEKQRTQFERLARWLGVGWSPKVLPVVNHEDRGETKAGVCWQAGQFPVGNPPDRWREHCRNLQTSSQYDFGDYTARLRQDWTIDGDENLLRVPGAFESTSREWRAYEGYLQAVIYRSSNMQYDKDNEQLWPRPTSYVAHLFRHAAWISVRKATELKAAHDVFVEDSEVHQSLAGWVFSPVEMVNAEVAKGIGIRREWSEVTKGDWQRWLKRSLDLNPRDNLDHRQLITTLYQQALRHFDERYGERNLQLWAEDIWCIEKLPDNTAVWHRETDHGKVHYVDRPDLARLRLEMLRTFPVELGWNGNKERAKQHFGAQPLSDHLRGEPSFTKHEADELAERIRGRLQDRGRCLSAYLKVRSKSANLTNALAFRVGYGLQVNFCLDGQLSQPRPVPTFFQPGDDQTPATLWLDAPENFADSGQPRDIAWEEVGSALCYATGLSLEDGAVFAGLLGCGEDSLTRKLLNLGVTETEVTSALPPRIPPPGPGANPAPAPTPPPPPVPPPTKEGSRPPREGASETDGQILDDMAPEGDLKTRLRKLSEALANETPEKVEAIVNRTVRRDTGLIQALKRLCEFRCQFPNCGVQIPKRAGGYYIEVAHIKPMRAGGQSVLGNLLVLCPNHHKEFDCGHVEIIEQTAALISGKLNGKNFEISFPSVS